MKETSERLIPYTDRLSKSDYIVYLIHLASYRYAEKYCCNKIILDFGSGSGYGSFSTSLVANNVIGVDIAEDAINYAKNNYIRNNLEFIKINNIENNNLPFTNNYFDVILSFQVIEHISNIDKYFSEIKRILKPDGLLLITTPNRIGRLYKYQNPWNEFHIKEYSKSELFFELSKHFDKTSINILDIWAEDKHAKPEILRRKILNYLTFPITNKLIPIKLKNILLRLLKAIIYQSIDSKHDIKVNTTLEDIKISDNNKNKINLDLFAIIQK